MTVDAINLLAVVILAAPALLALASLSVVRAFLADLKDRPVTSGMARRPV